MGKYKVLLSQYCVLSQVLLANNKSTAAPEICASLISWVFTASGAVGLHVFLHCHQNKIREDVEMWYWACRKGPCCSQVTMSSRRSFIGDGTWMLLSSPWPCQIKEAGNKNRTAVVYWLPLVSSKSDDTLTWEDVGASETVRLVVSLQGTVRAHFRTLRRFQDFSDSVTSVQIIGSSFVREPTHLDHWNNCLVALNYSLGESFSILLIFIGWVSSFQKLWLMSEITPWDCELIMTLLQSFRV